MRRGLRAWSRRWISTAVRLRRGPLPSRAGFQARHARKARKLCPGYDIYALENQWRMWAAGKPVPGNADAAFIAFARIYVKNHPL